MSAFEFMGYEPTLGDPKQLGIATIRAWGKIILRYKIVPGKDGHGWFSNVASVKRSPGSDGKDSYTQSFMLDSQFEQEQIREIIKANVNPYAQNSNTQPQQSTNQGQNVFGYQQPQQNQTWASPVQNQPVPPNGPYYTNGNPMQGGNFPQPRNPAISSLEQKEEVPF